MLRRKEIRISDLAIPSTEKIEKQVLLELIYSPNDIREARNIVGELHFCDPNRAKAFGAICAMDEAGEPIDFVTLGEKVGHEWVMQELVLKATDEAIGKSGANVLRHCYILKEGYIRRETYLMALRLLQQSARPDAEIEKLIGIIDDYKEVVNEATKTESTVSLRDAMDALSEALTGGDKHIPCGIPILDDMLYGGFDSGQLVILAARPSVGKTAVALWMAHNAGLAGHKAHIYSIEMTKEELAKRYIFAEGSINPYDLSRRNIDWAQFGRVADTYKDSGVYINDSLNTADGIISEIIRQNRMGQLDIAFVDYLGLLREVSGVTDGKASVIGMVTARFKELAKSLRIPVVLLCQLNRQSVQNGTKRVPQLADLRDSGSIEQDADIVLMLDPKKEIVENYGDVTPREREVLNMWVRKNRGGKRDVAIQLETNETHTTYDQIGIITE